MSWSYNELKAVFRRSRRARDTYRGLVRFVYATRLFLYKISSGRTFPPAYFNWLFASDHDPWRYQGNRIGEARKSLILALLPSSPVSDILELGCAAGWMTQDLSTRAEKVTAVDCSSIALTLAKERCEGCANIEFVQLDLVTDELEGSFDVVVCAGILNYLPRSAQRAICSKIVRSLRPGGHLLLEHLVGRMPGYEVGGELHMLYIEHPQLALLEREREDVYEIVLLRRK